VAMNVFAAESDEEARLLASSQQQSFTRLRSGNPSKLPPPVENYQESLPAPVRAMLEHLGQAAAVGTVDTVGSQMRAFIERTQADEIILSGACYDPASRLRSLELTMDAIDS